MPLPAAALLFDLDGLMVDSEPVWLAVEHALALSYGRQWSDALARSCVGTGLPNTIRTMREALDIPLSDAAGVERLVEGFLERLGTLRLKPGCRQLVEVAHGVVPMAVASSSTRRLVEAVLAHFDLTHRFAAVVSGESVLRTKPAPDIFLHAAAQVGRAPEACVVLEDSRAGVTAAIAAGMRVIAVPESDPEGFHALTPHVVPDLHAARALLGL